MARLTAAGKLGCLIVFVAVIGGGYYYAKTHGMLEHKVAEETPATQVDIAPQAQQPVQEAPEQQQSQPVQQVQEASPPVPVPVPQQQDASSNRGMQFLLNQGKSQ